jgi:hypothetical protein
VDCKTMFDHIYNNYRFGERRYAESSVWWLCW